MAIKRAKELNTGLCFCHLGQLIGGRKVYLGTGNIRMRHYLSWYLRWTRKSECIIPLTLTGHATYWYTARSREKALDFFIRASTCYVG